MTRKDVNYDDLSPMMQQYLDIKKEHEDAVSELELVEEEMLKTLEKANLEQLRIEFKKYCPDNTLKDLRHTFTTRARECGIDNELVSVWTGHSLGNITSSVYTHFSMEFQQEQSKKLAYN